MKNASKCHLKKNYKFELDNILFLYMKAEYANCWNENKIDNIKSSLIYFIYISRSENRTCDEEIERRLHIGYTSKCVQGYVKRQLLVLNRTTEDFESFPLKIMCCCDIEKE